MRILAGIGYRDDCRQAFSALRILTFPSQYIYTNLLFVKQNETTFTSHVDVHSYDTRNKINLVLPYWRLKRCQDGPGYWAVKFYNMLPQAIKCLSFRHFKKRVKEILITNPFYSFDEYFNFKF